MKIDKSKVLSKVKSLQDQSESSTISHKKDYKENKTSLQSKISDMISKNRNK